VAATVAGALAKAGIDAVLTGGACASIYTVGAYQSADIDFVLRDGVPQRALDAAMATVGFRRRHDRYVHSLSSFYVEFPRGPLSVGGEYRIRPSERTVGTQLLTMLSATDSCRDRLAAFIHWRDQQSLRTAATIALRNRVDLDTIESWCDREGSPEAFQAFRQTLETARRRRSAGKRTTSATSRATRAPRRTSASSSGLSGPSGSRRGNRRGAPGRPSS
jgi:hypothetical protein